MALSGRLEPIMVNTRTDWSAITAVMSMEPTAPTFICEIARRAKAAPQGFGTGLEPYDAAQPGVARGRHPPG